MSQMPDKIWLHKDTKYNTGDIVSAYQYEFAQEIECEGIENFVEYIPADAFIKRADEFISTFFHPDDTELINTVLNKFHEHMKLK